MNLENTAIPSRVRWQLIHSIILLFPTSPVDITEKRSEPGKNLKKAEFGIIRKQIFHRITYPKSSKIHLGENVLWPI